MIEDSICDNVYDFDGINTLFIKRPFSAKWTMETTEKLSPKGESRLIIKNPSGARILIHAVIQGFTINHMQMNTYVNDIQSLTNICSHATENIPFMLEINEIVSQETRIVIDFKGFTRNSSFLDLASITGNIKFIFYILL
ncbi:hypothetical protein PPL_12072 [Heterostelium album PN500]|uniref:Uncharacterized protein n=1 Tax=Heterostelium pallidum (strain ATCC 26659 / Pp 5 / PN500) TaxID=670386 RepID=D3BLL9_HETP5|nr:hypothetical protein PPL_12072 [Heterostelium album PN500]EFA77470.1 hypothetical protein PPL_12072 [Heterostelium album PN500]|eukprot:XP_020429598.1 hypothetical protein PPL_12072 [Heterostelium album PN500]